MDKSCITWVWRVWDFSREDTLSNPFAVGWRNNWTKSYTLSYKVSPGTQLCDDSEFQKLLEECGRHCVVIHFSPSQPYITTNYIKNYQHAIIIMVYRKPSSAQSTKLVGKLLRSVSTTQFVQIPIKFFIDEWLQYLEIYVCVCYKVKNLAKILFFPSYHRDGISFDRPAFLCEDPWHNPTSIQA